MPAPLSCRAPVMPGPRYAVSLWLRRESGDLPLRRAAMSSLGDHVPVEPRRSRRANCCAVSALSAPVLPCSYFWWGGWPLKAASRVLSCSQQAWATRARTPFGL